MNNSKLIIISLMIITFFGAFLRTYRFNEHLLFRADQARDAFLAKDILDKGIKNFPLLGPRASERVGVITDKNVEESEKESFHLGPVYYYIQFLPALVLESASPPMLAYSDLLLSILAIPLFYLLARKYFSQLISLATTALLATSFVMVQFSRFAWNTNQLIFWQLLYAILLLSIQKEQDRKKAGLYLLGLAFCLGILTQLHFLAMVAFPLITLIFWWFYRPQSINWRNWLGAVAIILVCYSPLIAFDIKNKGANIGRLLTAVTAESNNQEEKKRLVPTVNFHSLSYINIVSSINKHELKGSSLYLGYIFILGALIIITLSYYKNQTDSSRFLPRDPLQLLTLLWFVIMALLYLNLPSHLHKLRYWLLISPLPFLFLAYWLTWLKKIFARQANHLIILVSVILIVLNLTAFASFISALEKGAEISVARRYNSFEEYSGLVTFGQMKRVTDQMAEKVLPNNQPLCFFSEDRQLSNPYEYLLAYYYPQIPSDRTKINENTPAACRKFWITSTIRHDEDTIDEPYGLPASYKIISTQSDKASLLYEITQRQ